MVDKVKPLKIEDSTSGTEMDMFPTEANPAEDYLASKGIAFENSDSLLVDVGAGEIQFTDMVSGTKKVSALLDAEQENFDPTGSDLTDIKSGPAIRTLAGRNFGKDYYYDELSTFTTTSTTYVPVISYSQTEVAGTYRLGVGFTTTNSKSNTTNTTQVLFNAAVIASRTQAGVLVNTINGFKGDLVHPGGTLTFLIQTKRDAGNGQVELSDLFVELWRIA